MGWPCGFARAGLREALPSGPRLSAGLAERPAALGNAVGPVAWQGRDRSSANGRRPVEAQSKATETRTLSGTLHRPKSATNKNATAHGREGSSHSSSRQIWPDLEGGPSRELVRKPPGRETQGPLPGIRAGPGDFGTCPGDPGAGPSDPRDRPLRPRDRSGTSGPAPGTPMFLIAGTPAAVQVTPAQVPWTPGRIPETPGPAPGTPVLAFNLPRCNFKWLRWALLRWPTKLAMNAEAGELPREARGRGGGKTADQASVAKLAM